MYLCCTCLHQNVQSMKSALLRPLEMHLKKKCLNLLSYYQPECGMFDKRSCQLSNLLLVYQFRIDHTELFCLTENESESLKTNKLLHLSAQLDKEKKEAETLKETCRQNTVFLQRQIQLYLSVSTDLKIILEPLRLVPF